MMMMVIMITMMLSWMMMMMKIISGPAELLLCLVPPVGQRSQLPLLRSSTEFCSLVKESRRLHHQLYPNQVLYESGTTRWLVEGLQAFGHDTKLFPIGGSIVQALMVEPETGDIAANADFRKGGGVAGF